MEKALETPSRIDLIKQREKLDIEIERIEKKELAAALAADPLPPSNGPWSAAKVKAHGWCDISDANGNTIASFYMKAYTQTQANAYLAAAAPELLEALHNTLQFAERCHRECKDKLMRSAIGDDIMRARAAIAKATGADQ